MTRAWHWLRRLEIALWVVGVVLLGGASGATLVRWNYQTQQERALFSGGPAISAPMQNRVVPAPERVSIPAAEPFRVPTKDVHAADRYHEVIAPLRPAEVKRAQVEKEASSTLADPDAVGRIEIPRLGLAAIVSQGADEVTLARAVGLVPGSARPGEIGNMVLAGHRDTFFRPLRDIRVNDRIRVVLPSHTYEYRVQSLRVVPPEETDVLQSSGVEELTLVTCYPFRFIGPAPDRFIVSATRVN